MVQALAANPLVLSLPLAQKLLGDNQGDGSRMVGLSR
jgi:hypothetical protein